MAIMEMLLLDGAERAVPLPLKINLAWICASSILRCLVVFLQFKMLTPRICTDQRHQAYRPRPFPVCLHRAHLSSVLVQQRSFVLRYNLLKDGTIHKQKLMRCSAPARGANAFEFTINMWKSQ
ncbi:uncharacterized protein LOC143877477 isoform X2 [Tasmannia lanceolata]|uniref:uncharacterized protein LOC143877477 isoform X2 n=1 Tax=Tasmannia lanceolata TaxID=3420 RepID=UPI004062E248